ncbi:MAG: DUF3604 domain-containing protein [Alphaproteobacteria bacterium]|nr:DUF3604 domain-containing protein [Alphaproteobacteria bacterium]
MASAPEPEAVSDAGGVETGPAGRHALFGDLHVHSAASYDSFLFGNRVTPREAYRFARGEEITLYGGRKERLARPLDFVALTDHAEGFGMVARCTDEASPAYTTPVCEGIRTENRELYTSAAQGYYEMPPTRPDGLCEGPDDCRAMTQVTWREMQALAAEFNDPGTFTSFVAYEYSPRGPERSSLHHNVIFANANVPEIAYSIYEAPIDADLWRLLSETCTGECDVITIPHNMNMSWGHAYALNGRDGTPHTDEDLRRRAKLERLAEVFQIKSNSECSPAASSDEECGFEQGYPLCKEGQISECQMPMSTEREAVARGLALIDERGVDPFKHGFIGSTDTHNGDPGATDEATHAGHVGYLDDTVEKRRLPVLPDKDGPLKRTSGGLAGVWAEANTREAIFAAMKRRETFATSGPRLSIRMFASFAFGDDLPEAADVWTRAYVEGVAMGSDLARGDAGAAPAFLVWAGRDALSAPLYKLQMIKVWNEADGPHEEVYDVACSDGLAVDPVTHRCPDNGAAVDLANCSISADRGAESLIALWRDPAFDADARAAYYARALENPTCRWSTHEAVRDGREPPGKGWLAPTIRERAWSSPIWYSPQG